uniref:Uncharacterized protein n=1 Tax=Octopus bimaculoides TaxID=37653 RepID=A0A0L8G5H5_OCTBM
MNVWKLRLQIRQILNQNNINWKLVCRAHIFTSPSPSILNISISYCHMCCDFVTDEQNL